MLIVVEKQPSNIYNVGFCFVLLVSFIFTFQLTCWLLAVVLKELRNPCLFHFKP